MKNNYHKIMLDEISKNTNEIGLKLANKYEIKILKLILKRTYTGIKFVPSAILWLCFFSKRIY